MNILDMIVKAIEPAMNWLLSWFGADPRVEEIREKVASSCQFLPSVASVAAMLSASNPAVTGVVGIATAICAAVKRSRSASMTLMGTARPIGEVNGVPIEGDDLKGK